MRAPGAVMLAAVCGYLLCAASAAPADSSPRPVHSSSQSACLSVEREFEIVYGQLRANHADYLRTIWTSLGFIIVAIGWILVSANAQKLLTATGNVATVARLAVAVIAVSHVIGILRRIAESQRLLKLVDRVAFAPRVFYQHHHVSLGTVALSTVLHVGLLFLLARIIVAVTEGGREEA